MASTKNILTGPHQIEINFTNFVNIERWYGKNSAHIEIVNSLREKLTRRSEI